MLDKTYRKSRSSTGAGCLRAALRGAERTGWPRAHVPPEQLPESEQRCPWVPEGPWRAVLHPEGLCFLALHLEPRFKRTAVPGKWGERRNTVSGLQSGESSLGCGCLHAGSAVPARARAGRGLVSSCAQPGHVLGAEGAAEFCSVMWFEVQGEETSASSTMTHVDAFPANGKRMLLRASVRQRHVFCGWCPGSPCTLFDCWTGRWVVGGGGSRELRLLLPLYVFFGSCHFSGGLLCSVLLAARCTGVWGGQ